MLETLSVLCEERLRLRAAVTEAAEDLEQKQREYRVFSAVRENQPSVRNKAKARTIASSRRLNKLKAELKACETLIDKLRPRDALLGSSPSFSASERVHLDEIGKRCLEAKWDEETAELEKLLNEREILVERRGSHTQAKLREIAKQEKTIKALEEQLRKLASIIAGEGHSEVAERPLKALENV